MDILSMLKTIKFILTFVFCGVVDVVELGSFWCIIWSEILFGGAFFLLLSWFTVFFSFLYCHIIMPISYILGINMAWFLYLETIGILLIMDLMASIWEKAILILAINLNLGRTYLIIAVRRQKNNTILVCMDNSLIFISTIKIFDIVHDNWRMKCTQSPTGYQKRTAQILRTKHFYDLLM